MAVLSFRHLKESNPVQRPASPAAPSRLHGGVISFAHLKKQSPAPAVQVAKPGELLTPILQRASCIGVAKTAKIAAANYCRSCPRFWPADDNERAQGVAYGRCMRKSDGWVEEWRIIPVGARVYQCGYHRNNEDRELYGPAPCKTITWRLVLI